MKPAKIRNATRVMAKDQSEYLDLPIVDEKIDGVNAMTSLWKPDSDEIMALIGGGYVRLTILGGIHPPVMLSVQGEEP